MQNLNKYDKILKVCLKSQGRGEYLNMKKELHPNFEKTTITCACGNVMEVGSTKKDLKVDVCSKCHAFWTGNLKRETTGGRADKFKKKYGIA